jgi:uncharacterized protein (DUF934 family)
MPRRLLRDGQVVIDEWRYLGEAEDGGAVLPAGALIMPLADWQARRDAWIARGGPLGVVLSPSQPVESIAEDMPHLSLVAAEFTGPGEGRGYTQARLLRERLRFDGELRATGYVRHDQLFFMARCGFNAFELPDNELASAAGAFADFSAAYQASNDRGLKAALKARRI